MRFGRRRYVAGAVAAGALAAVGMFVLPTGSAGWEPVTYGLSEAPERLVPAVVSAERPARVVSTALDAAGRPVVTVRTATDRTAAAELVRRGQRVPGAVGVEVDARIHAFGGTDPYRETQWGLGTTRVAEAWQRSTGAGVTVAVIDTGVDATHPDLAGQVLPGLDLVTGATGPSVDPHGHGTHVAGTIAALTGNDIGVAGVAPDTRILPIRVLDADGEGDMSLAAQGIVWAADHGAQVINMSLGGTRQIGAVGTAVSYARSRGVVVVAAAGNDRASGSPTTYPAADDGVIAVAATDRYDRFSSFSNAGGYVDVAAPGSSIVSTVPGGYGTMSGTSMATPHVAAVAALLQAYRPGITPDQVEQALESTAVDLGTPGVDPDYGTGRIDAAAALAAVAGTAPTGGAPTGNAPTGGAPTTAAPESTTPTGDAPTSDAPTSSAPAPTTPAPSTPAPGTPMPRIPAPSTPAPSTPAPSTPAPTVSNPPVPVTPVVTSTVGTRQVAYGTRTSTTFRVTAQGRPMAYRKVSLCTAVGAGGYRCSTVGTSAGGTLTVGRIATGAFRLQVVVPTTPTTRAALATATYTVRATVSASRPAKRTLAIRVAGAADQTVQVQQYTGGRWRVVKSYPAASYRKVTGLVSGRGYRVVVAGTATVAGAVSATVRA